MAERRMFQLGERVRVKDNARQSALRGRVIVIDGYKHSWGGNSGYYTFADISIPATSVWAEDVEAYDPINRNRTGMYHDTTDFDFSIEVQRNAAPSAYGSVGENRRGVHLRVSNRNNVVVSGALSTERARDLGTYLIGLADTIEYDQKVANPPETEAQRKKREILEQIAVLHKQAEELGE